MKIKLHKSGLGHAKKLIAAHEFEVFDDNWDEVKPTQDELVHFLNSHDMKEYGLWFLGVNEEVPDNLKEHYVYPHGDLKEVQQPALEYSRDEANKKGHKDIAQAAQALIDLIEQSEEEDF